MSNEDAKARSTDPQTSHDAADAMLASGKAARLERAVLECLHRENRRMTTPEIAEAIDMHLWSISPRMAPLARKGFIARDGTKPCLNSNGRVRSLTAWVFARHPLSPLVPQSPSPLQGGR